MKILERQIITASGSDGLHYEVQEEYSECEYSEEWFEDSEDPIKDYVNNMLADSVDDFDNYAWDLDAGDSIYFTKFTNDSNIEHILYYNGKPIELYYVADM